MQVFQLGDSDPSIESSSSPLWDAHEQESDSQKPGLEPGTLIWDTHVQSGGLISGSHNFERKF